MPERADRTMMDYIFNAQANTSPVGALIPLADTWGWSVQVAFSSTASGNLVFQFTDFDHVSGLTFPFPAGTSFGSDSFQVPVSSAQTLRTGKAYDPLYNTPKWMRVSWNDSGSNATIKVFISITLKHQ